jgi:tRNA A-37 threonylcarbamoyl transferase component Bud32
MVPGLLVEAMEMINVMHSCGIGHGDLAFRNFLVEHQGHRLKIIDPRISRAQISDDQLIKEDKYAIEAFCSR